MELYKLVDGIRMPLTEQEAQETLATWEENDRIAQEKVIKQELEESLPTDSDKINALMSQMDYLNKTQNLPVSDSFQSIADKYEKLLHDKRFKEYKGLIESRLFKQYIKDPRQKTAQELFMEKMNNQVKEIETMANEAKRSNEEITKVLTELNDGFTAMRGFMMMLPEMQKSISEVEKKLETATKETHS
jgi:hypothetical protein